jgi:signal transduction histidine kinase
MLKQQSRLAGALQRSAQYRRRSTLFLVGALVALWLLLYFSDPSARLMSFTPLSSVNGTLAMILVFVSAALIAIIAAWMGGLPIEGEISAAQSALEEEVNQQTSRLKQDREKVRKSIAVADKSRHEFLNTMSFELRNPLNSIIGFSSILYQNQDENQIKTKRRRYAFDINRSAMHLLNIINEILDVSNLSTGASDLRIERVSVLDLLAACHQLSEIRGTKDGLAFVYDLPEKDFHFNCDPSRLTQVLLNLYSNAVKFTDPPGSVQIKVRKTDKGEIEFTVADEGIGVPVDEMEIVLQRFGKVDSQEYALRNEDGLGLGLSLVQQLTKMHQGKFKFESTEDVGTTVTITLPGDLMINTDIKGRNHS